MAKKTKLNVSKEDIANKVCNSINNDLGEKIYFLDQPEWNPSDITEWISTGNSILDVYISNRKDGGIPVGRITEINGLESSGKSLLVGHILAETQKKGGIAVLIDTENAISREFLQVIGIDLSKLLYIPCSLIEDVFEIIQNIIETVRKSDEEKLITIVVDSVMGATHKAEQEADFNKQGYNTHKAIILGQAMRKITETIATQRIALVFTNQLRQRLDVTFGDPWATSGGKAIAFAASLRLRLKMKEKIKLLSKSESEYEIDEKKKTDLKVVGIKVNVLVIKSRIGSAYNNTDINIYFDRGMDAGESWFEAAKKCGAIVPAIKEENGKKKTIKGYFVVSGGDPEDRFQRTGFMKILENSDSKQLMYDKICEKVIMKYKDPKELNEIKEESIQYENPATDI
jgi:protein RecA